MKSGNRGAGTDGMFPSNSSSCRNARKLSACPWSFRRADSLQPTVRTRRIGTSKERKQEGEKEAENPGPNQNARMGHPATALR
jgi:hypothetical protein